MAMIKRKIGEILQEAIKECRDTGLFTEEIVIQPIIEIPREEEFGDYSTNIAFILSPHIKRKPQDSAALLIDHMSFQDVCEKVTVAGKGFINFYVKDDLWRQNLQKAYEGGIESLFPELGEGKRVLIEFVSANPTGPLHIGHGRGAVVGDVLARILEKVGYGVVREYYVNDAGKQMETLGESTYLRWQELQGKEISYPQHCYQGSYIKDLAWMLTEKNIPIPEDPNEAVRIIARFAGDTILDSIIRDLQDFRVIFDSYYRESTLYEGGIVDDTIEDLKQKNMVYEKDGAWWFRTSLFEKDEDRVLVKSDGEKTYFASDIAYHREKFKRGFDTLIDIWGSDHHGYIPRLKASIKALGRNPENVKVILIQFVTLIKDGRPVGMSTRAGTFTTLREVLDEVGTDAARFFFMMRKSDTHLEFDLDLAKKTSNENPVYYVQYAHARISSIFRNAGETGIDRKDLKEADVNCLTEKEEIALMKWIAHFSDVIEGCARSLEPHRMTFYLLDVVSTFHSYYNKIRILNNDRPLTLARLLLLDMVQKVIRSGLEILGISAPDRM